jgi:hypothetical protein
VDTFVDAALARQRLDLTRWIGVALHELTTGTLPTGRPASFREAGQIRGFQLTLPNALERVDRWLDQDRAAGYIDDGYDEAQARLREWESWGPASRADARRVTEHALQQAPFRSEAETESTDDPAAPAGGTPETT